MKNVKWLSLVLALVLCLFALPAQAETVEIPTVYASISEDMPSNDELFNEYALRKLYGMEDVSFFGVAARESLPELMKELYDALKPEIEKIAAGNRSATTFTFTPEQLGAMGFTVGGSFTTNEEFNAICDAFSTELDDFSLLLPALLRDCPYEMYWCDYTAESSIVADGYFSGSEGIAKLNGNVVITLPVASAYSLNGSTTEVNTTKALAAAAAAAKAQDIVDAAQSMDDEAKLTYYAEQIMALVSYDHDAADNDTYNTDSNPWQLINVFDGNTSTNVVCEGYSKAFQYLCDLSTFDDAEVYTVSGDMAAPDESGVVGAGDHMWNIVSMGGKNYLVDVTNSEDGTVGMGGELFMAKAQQGGSVADGYVVLGYNNAPVTYKYDSDQESLWGEGVLKLAENVPVASITSGTTVTKYMDFADAVAAWTDGTTLTLLDDVTYDAYIEPGAGTRTFVGGKHTLDLGSANINNTGTLTITSGTITADNMAGGTIENWGELIINGNSVINNNENAAVINLNKFEATGGTLTALTGLDNEDDGVAVLNGTTLSNVLTWGNVTLTNCTITLDDSSTNHLDFRGGKVTINGDCAGWRVIYFGDNSAVVGTDIVLPDNYYLFRNATIIPTLEYHAEAIIGKHTSADHNYEYTPNGDGLTHDKTCTVGCGVGETNVPHTAPDAEGKCVCGAQLVAKVGGTYYADFGKAVAAWTDGTTLTLLDDVSYDSNIMLDAGTRTFVGNGHTLDLGEQDITNWGELTIKGGRITTASSPFYAISNESGTLIISDGTEIINTKNAAVVNNGGTLTATDCTLTGSTAGLCQQAGSAELTDATIKGVTIYGGNLKLSDCTVNPDNYHIQFFGGELVIDGECAGWAIGNINSAAAAIGTDKAIQLPADHYVFVGNTIVIELAGNKSGTIRPHTSHTYTYTPNGDVTHTKACTAGCGVGTVTEDCTLDENDQCTLCKAQCVASITSGSTVTKYMDFADAVAAWTDGTTLTLLDDVSYDSNINLGAGTRTFVGGKHTLTLTSEANRIYNDGTLTIASGTITSEGSYAIQNSGTLNIEGGIVSAPAVDGIAVDNMDGTLTITGGTVSATAVGGIAVMNDSGTLTITGGTVSAPGLGGYAIVNHSSMTLDGGTIEGYSCIDNSGTAELKLKSGTVTASDGYALYNAGTATLSGADLVTAGNNPAVFCNSGKTTISGGTLAGNSEAVIWRADGTLTITTTGCNGWKVISSAETATIGEDITLPEGYYVFGDDGKFIANLEAGVIGTITKHTHKTLPIDNKDGKSHDLGCACGAVSNQKILHFVLDAEDKCVCGAQLVAKVDEAYYSDIAVAMDDWANNGGTMTLLRDATYTNENGVSLWSENPYTFVGDGCTLELQATFTSHAQLTIESGTIKMPYGIHNVGTLHVKGGTIESEGNGISNENILTIEDGVTVTAEYRCIEDLQFRTGNDCKITINGGTFSCDSYVMSFSGSTVAINGGSMKSVNRKELRFENGDSKVTIKDGVIPDAGWKVSSNSNTPIVLSDCLSLPSDHYVFAGDEIIDTLEYAQDGVIKQHSHSYTATADDDTDTITYACTCGIGTQTAKLFAPAEPLVYNGDVYIPAVEVTDSTVEPAVVYTQNGQGVAEIKNAGDYTVTINWHGKEVSMSITILPADIEAATVTVAEETYTGFAITPTYTVSMNEERLGQNTDYTVIFPAEMANAGEKELTFIGMGNYTGTKKVPYTINKATPTVTAPKAAEGLTYSGFTQQLLSNSGYTTGGTLLYSLDGQTWSEEVPVGTEVGDYTVYYKVDGGNNYESVEAQSLTASIGKADVDVANVPKAKNRTYDGTEQPLVTAGSAVAGQMVYSLEENGTYTENIPTAKNAGDYTVWYYVQGGDNYHDGEKASVKVTIAPIMLEVDTTDAAYAKTYDGTTEVRDAEWKTHLTLGDVLSDDDVRLTMGVFPAYTTSKSGSYDAEIEVELSGEDAQNYKLTADKVAVTAIIEPKPLTATAAEGSRAYDATAEWVAPLELAGIIGSDDVSGWAEFQLPGINVGEYTEATLWEEPELTGADAGNYTIAPQDVTFVKATITKAAADKWSVNVAAQEVLVGSGLNAVVVPATGTGIGSEVVQITAMALYSEAELQTPATDADISGLGEDESITLYYKATADNYEAATGPMTVKAIAHQHVWTYTADEDTDTITAKCSGTIGTCPDAEQRVTLNAPDVTYSGNPVEAEVTCEGTSLTYTLQYSPNAPTNAGEYTVTMTVGDKSVNDTFTINPKDISKVASCQFSLTENSFVYSGEAPALNVTGVDSSVGNYTMQENADYTVGTVQVNAGSHKLTITGKGNYTGTVELDYEITRAPIAGAVITAESQVYTGEALEPAFTVELNGKALKHNVDFTFSWTNNVNVGKGKIVINGIGNYEGQAEGTFDITSAPADLTAETYLGESQTGDFTYGDVITIKGAVTVDRQNTFSLRRAPAANEVALYLEGGNEVIAGPVAADPATGEFTMTYDTTNKDIQIGQRNLKLVYVSDGNKDGTTGSVTVTLLKKELTIASAGAADREYEKDNKLVAVTGVDLDGIAAIGDDVKADLTGVQGTLASDNAGDYTTMVLPKLELTGSDKDYYTIAADEAVPTDVTITKAQLVSAELPTDVTLDTYLATADQVAAKLPATVVYTASNGDTVALDAAWTCADFDATPKAVNTFAWTVDASTLTNYELSSAVAATGTIKVTNTDALPVVITATDDSITFAEQPYGVAGMFAVDANAGDARYEVVSGDAVLNGATLTVNKVGEIVIRLTTEANGAYASAEATATLTVTKADPAVTAPAGLTATYGQTLASVELPAHDEGTWAWVDEAASVGDAGVQTHEITFTPNDTTNWNTLTLDVQVTVSKYNTQVEMMVLNGETETSIFTYGETVTVKAQPQRPPVFMLRSFTAPAANQMALFLDDEQISEAVDADETGIYTMTIPTADKALKPGDNAVTIKYVGTDNVEGAQGVVTVTLLKKKLSIVNMAAQSREYQPENQQVAVTAVELEGKLEGDDVAVGTLTAQVSSANVGSYAAATLPQTVPLAGEDADYYEAEGNVEVPVPQKVNITQATPEPTGIGADAGQPAVTPVTEDGKTLADIPLSLPEDAYNVPGTIHWVDGDDTPVEEGKEYAWVFIPEDPNYAPVNGTVVIYPAGEAPVITAPTAAQTVTVVEGETGTMTVTATEAEKYQWYIDRNDGKGYVAMEGASAATYTTSKVNTDNDGFTYYCQVSNAYGESKSPVFTLKVKAEVDVPQTGDEAQLGLWLALMVLSLGGMAAMVMNCKRREN